MEQNQDRPNPDRGEEREDQDYNRREVDPNNPTAEQGRGRQNEDIGGRESNANDQERDSDGRFAEEEDYDQRSGSAQGSTGSQGYPDANDPGYSSSRKGSL